MSGRCVHALRSWQRLAPRIHSGRLLVLLDYDGTLVSIAPTPARARPTARTRALLRRLSRLRQTRVGIVSGRALSGVRRIVGVGGLVYVGNHGLEISGPGVRFVHPAARRTQPLMGEIAQAMHTALRGIRGAMVESKQLTLSIHWRRVRAGQAGRFHRAVRRCLAPWVQRGAVRLTTGKRVIEVRPPVAWNKGHAAEYLMRMLRMPAGRVLYMGDDRTDEDAFRVVNRRGGVAVFVGREPRTTAARWWVASPRELRVLLTRLAGAR